MRSLEESCQVNGLALAPDTLASILAREHLLQIGDYQFRIMKNRIDADDFAAMCRRVLDGSGRGAIATTRLFYEQASDVLEGALRAAFQAINQRVASPIERGQNQEAWEALFLTFRGETASD
jgi:hypothetical protein